MLDYLNQDRRLDRLLLVLTALVIFVVLVGAITQTQHESSALRIVTRSALAGLLLLQAWPWLKARYAAVRTKLAHRSPSAPVAAIAGRPGVRRIDFYIALAALVLVAGMFTSARRYSVTHYTLGSQTIVFQRTDSWTGRAELWVLEPDKIRPRPAWVTVAGQP